MKRSVGQFQGKKQADELKEILEAGYKAKGILNVVVTIEPKAIVMHEVFVEETK